MITIFLDSAVGREKDACDIDMHRENEKVVVTLLVKRYFSFFLGVSRACVDGMPLGYFRDPTAESRIADVGVFKTFFSVDNSK